MIENKTNLSPINIPPFVLNDLILKEQNFISKIFLIIKGKILSYVINNFEGKFFCKVINFYYKKNGRIYFDGSQYFKEINNKKFYYPNNRILRIVNNEDLLIKNIRASYCLDEIDFSNDDVIIDCGANVGELKLAIEAYGKNINYFGFEPDEATFKCLSKNNSDNKNLFNKALSNKNEKNKFFLDTAGGNSSLVYFGKDNFIEIDCVRLDMMDIPKKIKLFKVEAEGFEPEVLYGAEKILKNIEYISVDFGSERGMDQKNTVIEVNSFLLNNNFKLYKFSNHRTVGLYKKDSLE